MTVQERHPAGVFGTGGAQGAARPMGGAVPRPAPAEPTAGDDDLAILTRGLGRSFGAIDAVVDVNLRVEHGSIVGLLGPNGSGKTTLIRMLATLLRPTAGDAWVGGCNLRSQAGAVRRRIGLTGQYAAVDEFLTGRENITMMGRLAGLSAAAARHRADELLGSFDLVEAGDRHLSTYSGGMRRRLDLALSLTGHPDIVFLDEPTTGLDPRSRFGMWQVIEALVADGTTVLLCTQYLEEADRLAQRVVILDEGRVVAEGAPADLREQVSGTVVELTLTRATDTEPARTALQPAATGAITTTAADAGAFDDAQLRIPVADPERLADVVRLLDGASIPFRGLTLHEPSLDDVFLALTGHGITPTARETP